MSEFSSFYTVAVYGTPGADVHWEFIIKLQKAGSLTMGATEDYDKSTGILHVKDEAGQVVLSEALLFARAAGIEVYVQKVA